MLARAHAFTIEGLHTRHVTVEVDVRPGLPAFTIVGLADTAVREARERINAAIRNSGYEFPARRITANLAPGDVPKAGPGLDLAIACAVLAASGQLSGERLQSIALFGELALDGGVRASHGTLAVAQATHRAGLECLALSPSRAHEAQLIDGLEVAAVANLRSAVRVLDGGAGDPTAHAKPDEPAERDASAEAIDLRDVRGQAHAVEALVIAAAGAHNMLLSGAPGTGKTMLAQRVCSILPPLSTREAIEVTRIHSLMLGTRVEQLARARPFRAPHHTTTAAGLVGGARRGCVGEVVLAHNGVLFLDELSEFSRSALEALRQPLEDGRVAIARASHSAVYPARFMLLAATNPCPCGYAGELERCGCSEAQLARHGRRLSGPLLDRIDLLVNVTRADARDSQASAPVSSAQARERVLAARERQARRLRTHGMSVN
ncbi:MAG TPA: YifB family Mg chelatase-like AAA ATPase, partial [Solirubrobacteraceae bacterium]|nr:YifB family Mg chelatase-like AAA ATPase [Solirubrobacteraceae bacterium]